MGKKKAIYGVLIAILVLLYVAQFAGVKFSGFGGSGIPTEGAIENAKKKVTSLQVELAELYARERERDDKRLQLLDRTAPFWRVTGEKLPTTEVQTRIERLALRSNVKLAKVGAPKTVEVSDDIQAIEVTISTTTSIRDFAEFAREVENHVPMLEIHYCSIRPNRVKDPNSIIVQGRIRAYVLSRAARDYLAGVSVAATEEEAAP